MSRQSITACNRLIHEFVTGSRELPKGTHSICYHLYWNLMMKAVKKFDNLDVSEMSKGEQHIYAAICDNIDDAVTRRYEIEDVVKPLIFGINWYNEYLANVKQLN